MTIMFVVLLIVGAFVVCDYHSIEKPLPQRRQLLYRHT